MGSHCDMQGKRVNKRLTEGIKILTIGQTWKVIDLIASFNQTNSFIT